MLMKKAPPRPQGPRSGLHRLLMAVGVFGGALASASTAQAELKLCNETSYVLETAIGYDTGDEVISQGWWTLYPGDCRVAIQQELEPDFRYLSFARSIKGHKGGIKSWGGTAPLCTGSGRFTRDEHRACPNPNDQRFGFARVNHESKADWTVSFSEPKQYSLQKARIAGVQRLLGDVNGSIKNVDGFMGRGTRRAISAYKSEAGLQTGDELTNELFARLTRDAQAALQERGLEFCNRTDREIWAALAFQKENNPPTSKGWYRLAPGQCALTVKDAVDGGNYFAFAETEADENGNRDRWGGSRFFCVNAVMFSIEGAEDCALSGYEARGFRAIKIDGGSRWTENFSTANRSVPLSDGVSPPAVAPPADITGDLSSALEGAEEAESGDATVAAEAEPEG